MYLLGSKERPIIIKVSSKEKRSNLAAFCNAHNFYYIVGLEFNEDVSDLKRALKDYKHQKIFMRIILAIA